jgi:aldehyde:ferredoxin oxidoreductase
MDAIGGYTQRIARFDLTREKSEDLPWEKEEVLPYIGGRGLAASLLYQLLPPRINPLGPENLLIFSVGPFVGTQVPFSGRWSVAAKSPQTGITGSGNAGGQFGAALKWTGLDALVITGKAASPSYLLIDEGIFTLKPAKHLWGKSPEEATAAIRQELKDPKIEVAAVGPAAEQGILLTTILHNHHSAGRGGLGAVMGSKNLKAVVIRGTKKVEVADPAALNRKAREIIDYLMAQKFYPSYIKYGSSGAVKNRYGALGGSMAFNAQKGMCPHLDKIDGDAFRPYIRDSEASCNSCPMPCYKSFSVPAEGKYGPVEGKGFQTATIMGYGVQCGMTDIEAILKAHALTNQYGLDLIALPPVIAFAMECYQRGIIGKNTTGGLDLSWTNANDAVLGAIEMMGQNRGFGQVLNRGVRALAEEWGEETKAFAFHVKGMECTATDARVYPTWGLTYAVSSRGADHMRGYALAEFGELSDEIVERIAGTKEAADPKGIQGKGKTVAFFEDIRAIEDSLELCKWPGRSHLGFPENLTDLFRFVTGLNWSAEEIRLAGERIIQLERLFNLQEGLTPADDTLPKRFLTEPVADGPAKGRVVDLAPLLAQYYEVRGWDRQTGEPKMERLKKLGLKKKK